jgi:hypothetical protein
MIYMGMDLEIIGHLLHSTLSLRIAMVHAEDDAHLNSACIVGTFRVRLSGNSDARLLVAPGHLNDNGHVEIRSPEEQHGMSAGRVEQSTRAPCAFLFVAIYCR